MWSGMALPSTNSTSFCRHNSRRILPIARRVLPKNSFLRYFGKITTWYLQSHFTWAWLCQSFMTVLLSPSGAFLKEDRLSRTTLERQSLLNSHRQSRWISYDLVPNHMTRASRGLLRSMSDGVLQDSACHALS